MLELFKLGGCKSSNKAELMTWLAREGEANYIPCDDVHLARFLNGLIIKNRGPKGDEPPEPDTVLSNNMVLKKLKIALNLQADDVIALLQLSDFRLSKHELSALFRHPSHKNYRECLDQLLRNFLGGIEARYRKKR